MVVLLSLKNFVKKVKVLHRDNARPRTANLTESAQLAPFVRFHPEYLKVAALCKKNVEAQLSIHKNMWTNVRKCTQDYVFGVTLGIFSKFRGANGAQD